MRVGVNLLWSLPGQVGGSEEYLARQLLGLAAAAPDVEATLFVPPGYPTAHPELGGVATVVGPSGLERRARRVVVESTWLTPRLTGFDVVHHGGGTMPRRSPQPAVVTVHDLQWLRYPEYVAPAKRRYLRTVVPASVRRAAVVAVPSDYVRSTVIEAYGIAPDRVVVVPHGVDPPVTFTAADEVRARYGLGDRPFVILPAITHPHKGHRFLLELAAGTGAWADPDLAIVLTGGVGRADAEVASTIARLGLTDRVVRPGRVPEADRDGLIAAADALVFPSEYEGFGAPVLEAMALGTPVVASDQAAVPEVVGTAGLVRPLDAAAWADALDEVRRRRDELVAAGRARAATFSAAASGAALADAYRRAEAWGGPAGRRGAIPSPVTAATGEDSRTSSPLRLVVIGPHFAPDTAPTGRVLTRIVEELAARGHELHVVTALPWYRRHAIEPGWGGRWWRHERTPWGSIRRLHPFPGGDRANLVRRAAGFAGFSALATAAGIAAGGPGRRVDAVIAMSPPLTMGLTGRVSAWTHRAPLVFNIQDVFPDAAVQTGAITNRRVIAAASALERWSYRCADAVTVLSDDLRANVVAKVPSRAATIHTIPNFVDTDRLRPADRDTPYRRELGLGPGPVVLYAGNIGFSQSLGLVVEAARRRPELTFLINGDGSARAALEAAAADVPNVRFAGFVADDRLNELLATGDVHVVPLRTGLGSVSVPSKTYSILAAGRPVVASIDPDTEIPRILRAAEAGVAVAPDDADALVSALDAVLADPGAAAAMGRRGRDWVVAAASPAAVGAAYEALVRALTRRPGIGRGRR